MGIVYAARDTILGRDVAIKTLLLDRADAEAVRRFEDEARVTARLPHPAIPPVHALGTLPGGRPFLAMKLIRGRTLAELLKERPSPADLPRFVGIFEAVCQGVAFAHSQGVVHRDLKPSNVMVGAFGEVQVMDWGIAKVCQAGTADGSGGASAPTDQTGTHGAIGTPAYMAPEQARGEPVGPRADVFALGGLLATILTGEPPHTGEDTDEVIARAARGDLSGVFARLDACGAEVAGIARRCLSPDPADRPADAGEVAGLVAAYRAGVEERLRQAERERAVAAAEAREQRKRRRVQLALAAAVGLLLAAGGAFAWWDQKRDADQARAEGEAREKRQEVERRMAAGRAAAEGLLDQAEVALQAGDAHRAAVPVEQAGRRVDDGGADDLRPRLARCRADLVMLRELDDIDTWWWTTARGRMTPWKEVVRRWKKAFAGYGITPGVTPPNEAARRVAQSPIRERLLATLEVWFVRGGCDPDLRTILAAADPDEFRDEARAADYQRALLARAFRGRPLPGPQPAWFAVGHGEDRRLDRRVREQLLTTAHRVRPDNFLVLMALGHLGGADDRESAAARAGWCRAALAVRPRSVAAWSNLGNALRAAGDLAGAVAAHEEAVRLDPESAPAHNNLGVARQAAGDQTGAVAAYREAIQLDRNLAKAYYNLGNALSNSLGLPGVVPEYREAVRLDPTDPLAQYNLGLALHAAGDLSGAVAAYQEAAQLDPSYAPAHNNLGAAYLDQGKYPEALACARAAIRADPGYANAHALLGHLLQATGDLPGARVALVEAARLDPRWKPMLAKLPSVPVAPPPRPAGDR
jgi:tetratricopeptide (TPR) repeat protein